MIIASTLCALYTLFTVRYCDIIYMYVIVLPPFSEEYIKELERDNNNRIRPRCINNIRLNMA